MDLQKTKEQKQKELKELADKSQKLQEELSRVNQEILRLDGSLKTIEELLKEKNYGEQQNT